MDSTRLDPAARTVGAVALAAHLLYGGMSLERFQPEAGQAAGFVLAALAGTALAVWALARLGSHAAAPWVAIALVGFAPVVAFVGWALTGLPEGILGATLWLNLLAGLAAGVVLAWRLAGTRSPNRRRRVARA